MPEPEPIRFTGTVVEWPDEGRRIVVEVGPDCHEYPAIAEPVTIIRHADAARSGATPDGLREAAQEVMDVADHYADDRDNPLWDDIPVELTPPLDRLRGALDRLAAATPPAASDGLPTVEALASAMDEAFTYEDPFDAVPTLRFADDGEAFWRPFAVRVAAALREGQSNG